MKIQIHIKGQTFNIECANGRQKISWLAAVAIHRIDRNYGIDTENVRVIQAEDGSYLNQESFVSDFLKDGSHVWIVLQGEIDPIKREETKRENKRLQSPPRRPGKPKTAK